MDLEPRAVDFITLHGSLLSSDPASRLLAFGLLCKLPRAILPYSYPLRSQNVPAPRAFRMAWVHSVHSQRRGLVAGGEVSKAVVGLRLDLLIHWSLWHCVPSPSLGSHWGPQRVSSQVGICAEVWK